MSERLFDEFQPVTDEQWLEVVHKDLKGAEFEKRLVTETLDGIRLKPYYRSTDFPGDSESLARGFIKHAARPLFREEIREASLETANRHAIRSLQGGATELAVLTYPAGVPIRSKSDLSHFTEGIWLDSVPIHWMSGPFTRPMLHLLKSVAKDRGYEPSALQGSVELDPIMDRCGGWVAGPIADWQSEFRASQEVLKDFPNFSSITIRGSIIEKSGASLAQELAMSVGLFTEYLTCVSETGDHTLLEDFVRRAEFRLGVGTNYFLEIAKIRALKVLVRNVLNSFGIEGVRPKFHAITTSTNKTLYDPFNNLLRATVEAMASTVGGVDSLSVAAYDQGYGAPDEFSEHLTRNTENLLIEEAYIGKVADPLGGSYAVESMTRSYAEIAWNLFKRMDSHGGFVAAWENGFMTDEIRRVQDKRAKQVATRKRTIVGTTVYPNPKEQRIQDVHPRCVADQISIPFGTSSWDDQLLLDGFFTGVPVPSTILDPFRPSWPFEHLRLRIERHVLCCGKLPSILLAEFGDKKMRRARSMFVQGFLGAGGYDVKEVIVDSPKDLEAHLEKEHADLVVLCSEDSGYLGFARELNIQVPIIVAGNPSDSVDDLKAAGTSEFLHLRLDQLSTLESFHTRFGIPPIPLDQPLIPEAK